MSVKDLRFILRRPPDGHTFVDIGTIRIGEIWRDGDHWVCRASTKLLRKPNIHKHIGASRKDAVCSLVKSVLGYPGDMIQDWMVKNNLGHYEHDGRLYRITHFRPDKEKIEALLAKIAK